MNQPLPVSTSAQYRKLKAVRLKHLKKALRAMSDPKPLPSEAAQAYLKNFMAGLREGVPTATPVLIEVGRVLAVLERIDRTEKALAAFLEARPELAEEASQTLLTTHE